MGRPKGSTNKKNSEGVNSEVKTDVTPEVITEEKTESVEEQKTDELNDELSLEEVVNTPTNGGAELSLEDLDQKSDPAPEIKTQETNVKSDDSHIKFGDDGYQEMLKQEKLMQVRIEKGVRRFYLGQEEGKNEAVVVFLDNPKAYTWEHEIDTSSDKTWKSRAYLSCVKDNDSCEVCGDNHRSYYVCYGSIFDTRKYEKEGQMIMQGRSLFGAKKQTMHKIHDLMKEYGDLRGLAFKVKRYPGQKEPKVGSDFKYLGKINVIEQFGKDDSVPFDYKKILARPSEDELKAYGIKSVTFGSDADLSNEEGKVDLSFL